MNYLIEPHGGRLINRVLPEKEAARIIKGNYRRIKVSQDFILDLEKIAIGAYSPLKGFMNKKDFTSVVKHMRLANGLAWTIPIYLPLAPGIARGLRRRERLVICSEDGQEIGLLSVEEVFSFNRDTWAKNVFGTQDRAHPGVKKIYASHEAFVSGETWLLQKSDFKFERFNLTPEQTRKIIAQRKWNTVAGFQTRNVPHRAHEYLQKIALTICDGILIHPIIGWKKDGDFRPEAIIESYRMLIDKYFPRDSVIFAGLATAMRYAGPREAVFHAIIRKNYGCTHFIVGRDHAGVGEFYSKYDAHRIFGNFPDLGIKPLLLREPYFCRKCQEIVSDKICPHHEKWHTHISGTFVRGCVRKNKDLPEYVMRKEVSRILRKSGLSGLI
ncbi:MAG TPA: sulfate adenylyltransferase [Candidatus Margulisiibacteriota bacterium]|nr:sulfate adenylyltransferase [Candidatus Margulisiibacteriota bacterium]